MPLLGPRELEILDRLWRDGSLSAQELQERTANAAVSLNTIQSTVERLRGKGLVERRKEGRAYRYAATLTRANVVEKALNDLTRDVGGGELAPIISGFVGLFAGGDPAIENEIMRLLESSEQPDD
ncbi:MAG: BlaI/MecI/CopY family transcriptional regulator [Pseudomonadales bacterium]